MTDCLVIMGSKSDLEVARACGEVFDKLGVAWKMTVSSAHRSPDRTERIVREGEADGVKVFICVAGMAAHLAGAVAARSIKPVIGIPVSGTALGGMDALLSTVQMPPGVPVATVSLDKAGAKNAAWLAVEILAVSDAALAERLRGEREKAREAVEIAASEI
ncbi:MAG: 5-(carboxyamino)imidazole ribonucleotide mutase [Desulfovibrio sp.]|nr:5-(carboxyamino)imidazole ribonucleotide mutase [Desulfovibrio sp.]